MNNGDGLSRELHEEAIRRFLDELDPTTRRAVGDTKIKIDFLESEREHLLVLHLQAENESYFWALSLLLDKFLAAAGRAGLENFSMCMTSIVGAVFCCKPK
jgi:hypothetical protein